jgi:hypothetical protein
MSKLMLNQYQSLRGEEREQGRWNQEGPFFVKLIYNITKT